ncbi:MAG: adenylate kinase [Nanoarchaeota archaeon]|nr:adenylate kinase [Nanoarchaeota archaeon]MBU1269797.1 adenylate kinase [Nanoarchaeota archaeon]MBU1604389.1 adenylate kinase [Nanoarchaeota archaeon]MBU2443754.1 adenylate kinase [Nanoarchaeota archaeon]
MKLLFLGSPGVGKGTYAQVLTEVLRIPQISTGDLLREEVKKETTLGKNINEIMIRGELVPDDIMIKLIKNRMSQKDCQNGFILDGFPRTLNQAEGLKDIVKIDHVLNFKANDEVIIERLSGRITCKKCSTIYHKTGNKPKKEGVCDKCGGELFERDDDKLASVKNRLDIYKKKTKPLIDYYTKEGLLVEITINKPISEIREKVITKINDYLCGKTKKIGEIN